MTNAALHVARTGLDAQQERMRVIANNIANVNTNGFKSERANFQTLAYEQITAPGATSSGDDKYATGLSLGSGVQMTGTARSDTQGSFKQTGNSLDLAIQGGGFFQVQMPDGTTAYTRDGAFNLSSTGQIVTADGKPVIPNMTVPDGATAITIGTDGTVSASVAGATSPTEIGKIETTRFVNPAGLQSIGGNLLIATAASGDPQTGAPGSEGRGAIAQGNLEASNVSVVEELVDMIETQRAYEVNSKMISATDQMLQYLNQNV